MFFNMLALLLATCLMLGAGCSMAAPAKPDAPLLLEIWVNGHTKHIIIQAIDGKEGLLADPKTLATAGIKFDAGEVRSDGRISVDRLPGLKAKVIMSEQKLLLEANEERIEPQIFELRTNDKAYVMHTGTGFIGQYDVVGTVDNISDRSQTSTTGAALGGTYFTPSGNFSTNGVIERQNNLSRTVRFDTSFERDDPDHMRRFIAGDAISGSQSWSRSVRFGGVQLATDFSLRPDLSTMPLPAFFGQTAVPANVDVFVNSARVFESGVEPGPFQINNLPVVTGSGEASMVVRNALGQETVVTLPFFASNSLLRPGLSSYDIDAGFLRTHYGEQSFGYDNAMMTGTYSYGARNWLTLETHSEAAKGVQLAGGGFVVSIAPYGVMHIASAVSHSDENSPSGFGTLHSFAVESETQPVGFFGSVNATTGNYADIATIGGTPPPQLQMQLGSHASLGDYGSIAGSVITIQRPNQQITRLTTASYTRSFWGKWNLGATGFYDHTHNETVVQGFLSYSMSNGVIADSSVQGGSQMHEKEAGITKPANPDGGFGYHASISSGDSSIREASATWINSRGSIDGAVAARDGQEAARVTASGGMVVMDGQAYATRRPDGSVALIETGAPGTVIYHENRQVAVADTEGKALITGLVPFTPNRISIDPGHYSLSTLIGPMDQIVTPGRQSGAVVDFTPAPHFPAIILLLMPDGNYPPPGSPVTLSGDSSPLVIGHRGEMFLSDLQNTVTGNIDYGKGLCHFTVAPSTARSDAIPRIGPVPCLPQQAIP